MDATAASLPVGLAVSQSRTKRLKQSHQADSVLPPRRMIR